MAESTQMDSSPEKRKPKERGIDDYKRKIWKLKKELEEKSKAALETKAEELENLRKVSVISW